MKESRVKIIVVTGVESSGKTTLTQALAEQYNEPWLDETAREYLADRNGNYTFEDIEKIAQLEYDYKYKQQLDSASIRELKLTKTVQSTSQDLEISQRNYLWAIIGSRGSLRH